VTPAAGTTFEQRLERLERDVTLTLRKVDALVGALHGDAVAAR
jgi:hypothetical protein